jgi:hypothetical protein
MVTWWNLYIYSLLMFCGGVVLYAVLDAGRWLYFFLSLLIWLIGRWNGLR